MFIGRETKKTHVTDENERKKSLRSAHLTTIILLEYYNYATRLMQVAHILCW